MCYSISYGIIDMGQEINGLEQRWSRERNLRHDKEESFKIIAKLV